MKMLIFLIPKLQSAECAARKLQILDEFNHIIVSLFWQWCREHLDILTVQEKNNTVPRTHIHLCSNLFRQLFPCFCLYSSSVCPSWYFKGATLSISIMRPITRVTPTSTNSTGNVCQHLPTDSLTNCLSQKQLWALLTERRKAAYWCLKIAGEKPHCCFEVLIDAIAVRIREKSSAAANLLCFIFQEE